MGHSPRVLTNSNVLTLIQVLFAGIQRRWRSEAGRLAFSHRAEAPPCSTKNGTNPAPVGRERSPIACPPRAAERTAPASGSGGGREDGSRGCAQRWACGAGGADWGLGDQSICPHIPAPQLGRCFFAPPRNVDSGGACLAPPPARDGGGGGSVCARGASRWPARRRPVPDVTTLDRECWVGGGVRWRRGGQRQQRRAARRGTGACTLPHPHQHKEAAQGVSPLVWTH